MRILGIDPGLQTTGFGVVDVDGHRLSYVASGTIRTTTLALGDLPGRLKILFDGITEVAARYEPDVASVEIVFVNEQEKACRVVVPDNQLSLAIGKEGQNARLAARLTSWKIDIKSQSQVDEQVEAEAGEAPTVEGDAE